MTRAAVIELAGGAGYAVEEGAYPLDELAGAEEAFTSSSVREVMPVVELDDAPIAPRACRGRAPGRAQARPPRATLRHEQGSPRRDGARQRGARARADVLGLRDPDRLGRDQGRRRPQAAAGAGVQQPFLRGPAPPGRVVRGHPRAAPQSCPRPACRSSARSCSAATLASALTVQVVRRSDRLGDARARAALRRALAGSGRCSRCAAASSRPTTAPSTSRSERTSTARSAPKEHERCGSHLIGPLLAASAAANVLAARAPARFRGPRASRAPSARSAPRSRSSPG